MEWNVKNMLKALATASALVVVVATFSFFIERFRIPNDPGMIVTTAGQFIFDKADSTIDGESFLYVQRFDSTAFVSALRDTFIELCNIVPAGTSFISVRAFDKYKRLSAPTHVRIIKTADSIYCDPWPPTSPQQGGYVFEFSEGVGDTTRATGALLCDGVLSPGVLWCAGYSGGGVEFVTPGQITLPAINTPSLDSLTVAAWVYPYNFNTPDARIISKATGTAGDEHYFMLSTYNNNAVRFRLKTVETGSTTLISAPNVITANKWQRVVAKYNGAEMLLLVDGALVGVCEKAGQIAHNPTVPVAIGNQPQGGRPFCGKLDGLEIK